MGEEMCPKFSLLYFLNSNNVPIETISTALCFYNDSVRSSRNLTTRAFNFEHNFVVGECDMFSGFFSFCWMFWLVLYICTELRFQGIKNKNKNPKITTAFISSIEIYWGICNLHWGNSLVTVYSHLYNTTLMFFTLNLPSLQSSAEPSSCSYTYMSHAVFSTCSVSLYCCTHCLHRFPFLKNEGEGNC
jgi:hypothetical protein